MVSELPVGLVVIGLNEGEQFKRCVQSLLPYSLPIVYVDSHSTDGSVDYAKEQGIKVIELDLSIPFTAARARNVGFAYLTQTHPDLDYVQFIDGDCELIEGWLESAMAWFECDPQLAVVCGRNYEKYPRASVYNRLADVEWNTPVGEAKACGGIALMRVKAVQAVKGFRSSLHCGEEPELCIRLRQAGWTIQRIDAPMSLHDSDMHHFAQWWKRMVRGGWAIAEGFAMYGHSAERYMVREHFSGWLWGFCVPAIALALAWPTKGLSLLLFLGYGYLMSRIYKYRRRCGDGRALARTYAFFCTLSKFPQVIGQARYWLTRWRSPSFRKRYKALTSTAIQFNPAQPYLIKEKL